jgi:1,4-alpha-glucan branching enzyme
MGTPIKAGAFTFVLHSHLPYCRNAGRWPHGEEWIHEAASETYIPLLNALWDLRTEGIAYKLTLSLTPVLVEQLADPLIISHLDDFLKDKLARAQSDVLRYKKAGQDHLGYLARLYFERYQRLLESYHQRFGSDIIGSFRKLQDAGNLEIVTSAATHAYLPLLQRDSSIYAQLKAGVDSYKRHFGRLPRSVWLPECGYRPAYNNSDAFHNYVKPGLESYLEELGLSCFFAETHTVEGGRPVGKATGEVIGPYAALTRRYALPVSKDSEPGQRTTFLPYYVGGSKVAVIGRNNETSMQVWSADWGYPGDFQYREFHKKDGISGLQYWRVTGAKIDLGLKEYYDPYQASLRVQEHARHFAGLVEHALVDFYQQHGHKGIVASNYDTELFGHWWFEGVDWLKQVLKILSASDMAELMTASEFLADTPPESSLNLPEGSWGAAGGHFTWKNVDTDWMWPRIYDCERKMEELAARFQDIPGAEVKAALDQAAREMFLVESSDWPFLVTTGQAREYATQRFTEHIERFDELVHMVENNTVDTSRLAVIQEKDRLFPDLDYRLFRNREAYAKIDAIVKPES